jgi:nucleoside-diphosphate-sugar epimerase
MSILVTGGTGFIGAEIVRMLIAAGEGPITVAQRSTDLGRLADLADQIELIPLDLSDVERTEQIVRDLAPRRIFHFGAMLTGPGEQDPPALLQANAWGFIKLIEAARVAGTEQMIFASSIGTYGRDLDGGPVDDRSLQRPHTVYGVSKVLGENLGAYYRTRYGFDYRGIRYPSIVGPGVTTWSLAQYTSWMIEKPLLGEPFEVWVRPEAIIPILYYKDAARAALDLAAAPSSSIRTINYLVDGLPPTPDAGAIAEAVRARVPDARITFDPAAGPPRAVRLDDRYARQEWGWEPRFGLPEMIDDMEAELRR